jgi:alpha-tubulin suppressor-like RCC1 family protein
MKKMNTMFFHHEKNIILKKIILVSFLLLLNQLANAQCWSQIATGENHTLAIRPNGTLWAWGKNDYGQLGDGTTTNRLSPVQVGSTNDWLTVATGYNHNLAIKFDGTLWAWGANAQGQLGDGSTIQQSTPIQIGTSSNWYRIAAGNEHSLAVQTNGTLWSWGDNAQGQLGRLVGNNQIPVQVGSSTNWIHIAAGLAHSLCIKTDGTLWGWGGNGNGQLGLGNTMAVSTPQQVGTANTWMHIAAGKLHSLAIQTNGTLWGWGNNVNGQLGLSGNSLVYLPTQIGSNTNWTKISAGSDHSIGVTADLLVHVTGNNAYGQLGSNTLINSSVFSIPYFFYPNGFVEVSAGGNHTATLLGNGELFLWGSNAKGEIGDATVVNKLTPTLIKISWYLDADGDHYYTGSPISSCSSPGPNYVNTNVLGGGDTDDTNPNINPGELTFLTTDSTWKSSTTLNMGWEQSGFNDSSWDNAKQVFVSPFNGINNSIFIWSNDLTGQPNTAYLRKKFMVGNNVCSVRLSGVADDDMEVYINGSLIYSEINGGAGPDNLNFDITPYIIPNDSNVVAIKAINAQCCYFGTCLQIINTYDWYMDSDGDLYTVGAPVKQCVSPGNGYIHSGILGYNDCDDNNALLGNCQTPSRVVLNGTTDYITAGNLGNCPDQGSISFLMNWDGTGSYPNALSTNFQNNPSTIDAGFSFQVYSGFVAILSANGSGYELHNFFPSSSMQSNQNYHIVLTWDKLNNHVIGYTNGVKVFDESNNQWPAAFDNFVMGIGSSSDRFWPGTLDDISVWNKQLSQEEVYHALHSDINVSDPALRAYYSFNSNVIAGPGITVANESATTIGLYNATTIGSIPNTPYFANVNYQVFNSPPVLTTDSTNFCFGTPVTFTAQSGTGVPISFFKFYVNGLVQQSGTSHVFTTTTLNTGDVVSCEEFNNYRYYTPVSLASNTLTMTETCTPITTRRVKFNNNSAPYPDCLFQYTNYPKTNPVYGSISFTMNSSVGNGMTNYASALTTNSTTGSSNEGIRFDLHLGSFKVILGENYFNYTSHTYTTNAIQPNTNYHVVLTWDRNLNKVWGYLDGELVFENTNTTWVTNFQGMLLGLGYSNQQGWLGSLDDVSFWDKKLSHQEVYTLLHHTIDVNDPNLWAYYSFDTNTVSGPLINVANQATATLGNYNLWNTYLPHSITFTPTLYQQLSAPPTLSLQTWYSATSATFVAGSGVGLVPSFYEFFVNGISQQIGISDTFYSTAFMNGEVITCKEYNPLHYYSTITQESNSVIFNGTQASDLHFDGVNDYVALPNGGGLSGIQTGTIEMWVKWNGSSQNNYTDIYGTVCARQSNGSFSNQIIALSGPDPNTAKIIWRPYYFSSTPIISPSSPGNGWNHIAITYSSGNHKMYVNGVLVDSSFETGYMPPSSVPLTIGAWIDDGQCFSNSNIDEVRIWNYERSAIDIAAKMNCEIVGSEPGLLGNYHFNQGVPYGNNLTENELLNDASAIHGTLNNMALQGSTSNWVISSPIQNGVTCNPFITLNLKLFIQGYYIGNQTLNNVLYLAGQEATPSNNVENVNVYLYKDDAQNGYPMLSVFTGVLQTDGTLNCSFPSQLLGQSVFIAVTTNNAITTWSATSLVIAPIMNYDFTTAQSMAFGNNQIEVEPTVWAFYSGDVNQDFAIDAFDYLIQDPDVINGVYGYFATDLTGDGNVDAYDYIILDANLVNGIGAITP